MQKMKKNEFKNNKKIMNNSYIKNESGITLITLVVMIIVVLILALASIYAGGSSMNDIVERQDRSTISMIQEIVMSQYSKAIYLHHTGRVIADSPVQPSSYYGDPILDAVSYFTLPKDNTSIFPTATEYETYILAPGRTYDDCYFRLTAQDLKNLGITDSTENNETVHSYIVKYSTGEVYDETLALTKYYVKGNRNIKHTIEKMDNNIEVKDFDD